MDHATLMRRAASLDIAQVCALQALLERHIHANVARHVAGEVTPDLEALRQALDFVCHLLGVHSWAQIGA